MPGRPERSTKSGRSCPARGPPVVQASAIKAGILWGFELLEAEVISVGGASGLAPPSPVIVFSLIAGHKFPAPSAETCQEMGRGVLQRPRNRGRGSVKTRSGKRLAGRASWLGLLRASEAFSSAPGGRRAWRVRGLSPCVGRPVTTRRWRCRAPRPKKSEAEA